MAVMADMRPPVLHPALICVADVDTRLTCSACCPVCRHYTRDRRLGERRATHRPTPDRRVLGRV